MLMQLVMMLEIVCVQQRIFANSLKDIFHFRAFLLFAGRIRIKVVYHF